MSDRVKSWQTSNFDLLGFCLIGLTAVGLQSVLYLLGLLSDRGFVSTRVNS